MAERDVSPETAAGKAGVELSDVYEAAELLRFAGNVVFIHSPDRARDAASDDMEIFADLTLLLRGAGKTADILLPRLLANSAGLEVMGADPAFLPGRVAQDGELPGAASSQELRKLLEDGSIRAALIIGENPLEYNRPGSWFQNAQFLAAMDWTDTETTRFADVTLPGTTYLETPGTRCNFEGSVISYSQAVEPPSGKTGVEVLQDLAEAFGVSSSVQGIEKSVRESLGDLVRFYWNTGEERSWDGSGLLVPVTPDVKTASIQPPMTHSQEYRQEIRQVGTERYRVI
jgi:predicted molibdopterin-dependent oxidoreductase YjgC